MRRGFRGVPGPGFRKGPGAAPDAASNEGAAADQTEAEQSGSQQQRGGRLRGVSQTWTDVAAVGGKRTCGSCLAA
jgi:hypothetical protein